MLDGVDAGNLVISFVSIAFSTALSVWLAYMGMNRKLDKIISAEYRGVLTRLQAEALVDIYLEMIRKALQWEIDDYCDHHLDDLRSDNNKESVHQRLNHVIQARYERQRQYISLKFSSFNIGKQQSFMELLDSVKRDEIPSASEETFRAFVSYLDAADEDSRSNRLLALKHLLATKMALRNFAGRRVLLKKVRKWYRKHG